MKNKKLDLSSSLDVTSRLEKMQAKKILVEILNSNPSFISYSKHGLEQMRERNLRTGDVFNVLKAGKIYADSEIEHGSWRYRVQTKMITVVIAFVRPNHVKVITAWRNQ